MSDPSPVPNGLASSTSSLPAPAPALDQPISAPPEVEATLARLSAYRHVRGVMILSRSGSGLSGPTSTSSSTEAAGAEVGTQGGASGGGVGGGGGIVQATGPAFEGEAGKKYARALESVVAATSRAVAECDEGDDVKFMRIRTKKHELILTPDERYLLIVLQDPQ